jgi:hypothetical protein
MTTKRKAPQTSPPAVNGNRMDAPTSLPTPKSTTAARAPAPFTDSEIREAAVEISRHYRDLFKDLSRT